MYSHFHYYCQIRRVNLMEKKIFEIYLIKYIGYMNQTQIQIQAFLKIKYV